MVDLTSIPLEQLRREWHALLLREQTLGNREALTAVELELLRRSLEATR